MALRPITSTDHYLASIDGKLDRLLEVLAPEAATDASSTPAPEAATTGPTAKRPAAKRAAKKASS